MKLNWQSTGIKVLVNINDYKKEKKKEILDNYSETILNIFPIETQFVYNLKYNEACRWFNRDSIGNNYLICTLDSAKQFMKQFDANKRELSKYDSQYILAVEQIDKANSQEEIDEIVSNLRWK